MNARTRSTLTRQPTSQSGKNWFLAALLVTAAVSLLLLLLPLATTSSEQSSAPSSGSAATQQGETTSGSESLLAQNGPWLIAVLAVPVLIAALPLLAGRRRQRAAGWGAAALLGIGALVSILSVGLAYLPSVVLLAIGALRSRPT